MSYLPGDKVDWRYETRLGYGYISYVPAVVQRSTPKRVVILVLQKISGKFEPVEKTVTPTRLTRREKLHAVDNV